MILTPSPKQQFFGNNGRPLDGGLVFTYAAGTNNKLATYSDKSGTPNTNPIVLDFRGEANIWLDPELTYKFVLSPRGDTDPPTNPIWSVDDIAAGLTVTELTQQFLGRILWPRTQSEINAGITPVFYYYEPGDVRRQGAIDDNTTDNTTAFQQTLDGLPLNGEMLIPGLGGIFLIAGNLTVTGRKSIIGAGTPNIRHTGNGHLFQLTGSSGSPLQQIKNLDIEGTVNGLSGIYANGANNGPHTIDNCYIHDYSGANAACIRLNDAYAYRISGCWLRDSSIGIYGEAGGVNEILVMRNHITNNDIGIDAIRGNHWEIFENFFTGSATDQIGIRLGVNVTSGEPLTDVEIHGAEFEGSFDICIDVGPGATEPCRGIAIIYPECDVVDAVLGTHHIRVQNTIGFQLNSLGRFAAVTGAKKWYSIASTVSGIIISDSGFNSAQVTITPTDFTLITQDRVWTPEILANYTSPVRSSFLARPSGTITDVTGNGTVYTLICNSEIVDRQGEYSTVTGIFTAQKAGQYNFAIGVTATGVTGMTFCQIRLVTSNRTYDLVLAGGAVATAGGGFTASGAVIADMDAGDTALVTIEINGLGADTADIATGTYFSGAFIG